MWGWVRCFCFYRVVREKLFDKVTFGQGSEEGQREFVDIKLKNLPRREIISCKGS